MKYTELLKNIYKNIGLIFIVYLKFYKICNILTTYIIYVTLFISINLFIHANLYSVILIAI
jgi:hypothetical protein